MAVKIPKLLSLLIHFDPQAEVIGLNEFPEEERPPVFLPFMSYHIMILLGMLFILISVIGLVLMARRKLWTSRWYLSLLLFAFPLPLLANEFGWIAAEVGRQPWAVYKVLKTADAASKVVPAGNILFSLIMFTAVYTLIAVAGGSILIRMVKKGPDEPAAQDVEGGA
jgi:cytochrome d ubiquinol oxidase subunit I